MFGNDRRLSENLNSYLTNEPERTDTFEEIECILEDNQTIDRNDAKKILDYIEKLEDEAHRMESLVSKSWIMNRVNEAKDLDALKATLKFHFEQ